MEMKYRIYWEGEISAAHYLDLPYESKCKNLHGHNYRIQVWVESEDLNKEMMIIDFSKIKEIVNEFDHTCLNDFTVFVNPTAERIAEVIARRIIDAVRYHIADVKVKVRVWEDKYSYAEFEIK